MATPLRILHLEDNPYDAELVEATLRSAGLQAVFTCVQSSVAFEQALGSEKFDIALCDYNVPGFQGFAALQRLRSMFPHLPVILLSGTLGEEDAVECLKNGATDYILKGRLHRLVPAIQRALEEAEVQRDRDSAYDALRLNEERLSCVLLATNDAVYDLNLLTDHIWWNQGLRHLFGYNPRDVSADLKWWERSIHPEDRLQVLQGLSAALGAQRLTWENEYRFLCSDGSYAHVYDRGYILRDENGKGIRMVGAMMDVSDKKRMEQDLLRSQRMQTIGSIAGGVAHDLNNMLSPILVASELLSDYVKDPAAAPFLEMIRTSVMRGTDVVKQILGFVRGDSGTKSSVDMLQFGNEIMALIGSTFPKNIQIDITVAPGTRPAYVNRTQLHQVILNLCVNARDAMPNGGRLTIAASGPQSLDDEHGEEFIQLRVTDTGTGIPAGELSKIFDPFYSTKKIGQGTGLGLATVRAIIEEHRGTVAVESVPGKGTTFLIHLPADGYSFHTRSSTPRSADHILGAGERVLIIEEEASIAQLIETCLESHHFKATSATNIEEAIQTADRVTAPFHIVISDHPFSDTRGQALINQLRKRDPDLRTILVSASSTGRKGEGVLIKPFTTQQLLDAVGHALHKGAAAA